MNGVATVEVEVLNGVPLVRVAGEVDAANASEISTQVFGAVGNHGPGLVIDLTDADYLDSAGIRFLFEICDRLRDRGQSLRIVARPESFVLDVLDSVRFSDSVDVDETVAAAVRGLTSRP